MEKSSRESIAHKIRRIEDGEPDVPDMSDHLALKLTKHFNSQRHYKNKFDGLKTIYHFTDMIVEEMSKASVCRKGCAHCCKIPVEILPIEAEYITKNTKYRFKESPLLNRLYCPFLDMKTATCKVYEYRPFNCRTFLSFDSPDYCRDMVQHYITGGPGNGWGSEGLLFLGMEMVELDTGQSLSEVVRGLVKESVRDIREYF